MIRSNVWIFLVLCLTACQPKSIHYLVNSPLTITRDLEEDSLLAGIIAPYQQQLSEQMNQVIGYAGCDMYKARPEGRLGNFLADAGLEFGQNLFRDSLDIELISLFNHGGLRAPINKGEILLRHLYELMPFDNQFVLIKLHANRKTELVNYLRKSGGEPLAGFTYSDSLISGDFWVVTSDYLADGGDNMTFFSEPLMRVDTGVLLRAYLIERVRETDTLCTPLNQRWR